MLASTSAVEQAGRVPCIGPLPQALQRLGIAEGDGGFQARARLHLGQIHDGIDQARPAARGHMPGRRMQRCRAVPSASLEAVTSAAATV